MLWLFFPFVVILAGFIAYAADTIAKKVGRKHVRWFGLRPKTTALIVAILAGMGISIVSLTAFLLLNRNAVATIAQADRLRPTIEALRKEVRAAENDLETAEKERDAAFKQAEHAEKQQKSALSFLKAARQDLQLANANQQKMLEQTTLLQGRLNELEKIKENLEKQEAASRKRLKQSQKDLDASKSRAETLDQQVVDLQLRSAQAVFEIQQAQQRANKAQKNATLAQQKTKIAQQRAKSAQAKAAKAQAAAASATSKLNQLNLNLKKVRQKAALALQSQKKAEQYRKTADKKRQQALTERNKALEERDVLIKERAGAMKERDKVKEDLAALGKQKIDLQASNASLSKQLKQTQDSLEKLRDEYSSTRIELTVSKNSDWAFLKNQIIFYDLVPSVRNLPFFLQQAADEAQLRGAKGADQNPAARINPANAARLEKELRQLNTTMFILCRATRNSSAGFPVDMSCEARPNVLLYPKGAIIRKTRMRYSTNTQMIEALINELEQEAVLELTTRGVPLSFIIDQGLDQSEKFEILKQLNQHAHRSVEVSIATRQEIKPNTRVDLYPVFR